MLSSLNERFEIVYNSSKYVSFKRSHCAFCLIVPKIKIMLRCIHNIVWLDKTRCVSFLCPRIFIWTWTFKNARVSLTSWTSSTRDSVLNIPRGRKETIHVSVSIIAYHNFFSTIDSTSSWSFYDLHAICMFYIVLTYTRARMYLNTTNLEEIFSKRRHKELTLIGTQLLNTTESLKYTLADIISERHGERTVDRCSRGNTSD